MKINPAVQSHLAQLQKNAEVNTNGKADFGSMLKNALNQVNELQLRSDQANMQLVTGEAEDLHSVLLTAEEARLAFELAVQVRNKLVESYQEINGIQL